MAHMTAIPKQVIVFLNEHVPPPEFKFPHALRIFDPDSDCDLAQQVSDATIICTGSRPLQRNDLEFAPNLRLVACLGTGTEHIDREFLRDRGILLCNIPAGSTDSVAEHAIALYLILQRKILHFRAQSLVSSPNHDDTIGYSILGQSRTSAEQIAGIIGYGSIGQKIATLSTALGMDVRVAERKNSLNKREGRVPYEAVIKDCSCLFVACPLTADTQKMISGEDISKMRNGVLIINVARADIIDETALASGLKSGKIGGYGVDALRYVKRDLTESASLTSATPNFIATPHIAWASYSSIKRIQEILQENITEFLKGKPKNIVVVPNITREDS